MWAQCTQAELQLLLGCQNLMINCRKLLCSLSEPGFLESKTPLISGAKPPKIFSNQILSPKCLGVVMRSLVKMRKIMRLILSYLLNWQKCLHHLLQCSVRRTQDYLNINAYKSFGWENSQEALTIFFFFNLASLWLNGKLKQSEICIKPSSLSSWGKCYSQGDNWESIVDTSVYIVVH